MTSLVSKTSIGLSNAKKMKLARRKNELSRTGAWPNSESLVVTLFWEIITRAMAKQVSTKEQRLSTAKLCSLL